MMIFFNLLKYIYYGKSLLLFPKYDKEFEKMNYGISFIPRKVKPIN